MSPTLISLEEQENIKEHQKMQMLQIYQNLFLLLIYKQRFFYIFLLVILIAAGAAIRYFQYTSFSNNFSGEVTLFYSPDEKAPVRSLNLPQLMEICSRSQVMKQLGEEMGITPKEQSMLNDRIKVQLLRDQRNMFKILGTGPTRAYVQNLLNTFSDIIIRNYREYRLTQLNNYLNEKTAFFQDLEDKRAQYITQRDDLCHKYNILDPIEELNHLRSILNEYHTQHTEMKINLNEIETRYRLSEKKYNSIPKGVIENARTLQRYLEDIRNRKKDLDKIRLIFIDHNPRVIECRNSYDNICREFEEFKKKNNILNFREEMLMGLEKLVLIHTQNTVQMEMARSNLNALEEKINSSEQKRKILQVIAPDYRHLTNAIKNLTSNIMTIDEDLIKARGCLAHVTGDLSLNERLYSAHSDRCFSLKVIILIVGGAVMLLVTIIILQTGLAIIYGKIRSFDELLILKDVIPMLGVIPRDDLQHEEEAATLISTLYYNVMTYLKQSRSVFTCAMDGRENASQIFYKKLIQNPRNSISLCLMKTGKLDFLQEKLQRYNAFYYSDQDLTELDWEHLATEENIRRHNETVLNGQFSEKAPQTVPKDVPYKLGDRQIWAYFPVQNINALSPEETVQLRKTIKDLNSFYKFIIIRRLKDFRTPCMLIKQLMDICDSTVLFIGKHSTPRKMIRKMMALRPETHQIYSVLTNSSLIRRIAKGEYF